MTPEDRAAFAARLEDPAPFTEQEKALAAAALLLGRVERQGALELREGR